MRVGNFEFLIIVGMGAELDGIPGVRTAVDKGRGPADRPYEFGASGPTNKKVMVKSLSYRYPTRVGGWRLQKRKLRMEEPKRAQEGSLGDTILGEREKKKMERREKRKRGRKERRMMHLRKTGEGPMKDLTAW